MAGVAFLFSYYLWHYLKTQRGDIVLISQGDVHDVFVHDPVYFLLRQNSELDQFKRTGFEFTLGNKSNSCTYLFQTDDSRIAFKSYRTTPVLKPCM
jgi:hypothetical protein